MANYEIFAPKSPRGVGVHILKSEEGGSGPSSNVFLTGISAGILFGIDPLVNAVSFSPGSLVGIDPANNTVALPTGNVTPGLNSYGSGSHVLPAGTYTEVTILVYKDSIGVIDGDDVGSTEFSIAYEFKAAPGKALGEITFGVSAGKFQVLTLGI